ncbi:MAG: glycosyltransferase family 4 protein [Alphaproteobacteria bacterium]
MRVLLLSRYGRLGATSRQRHLQYLPALRAAGFEVAVDALLDDGYLRRMHAGDPPRPAPIAFAYLRRIGRLLGARRWDGLWIEKEILPWLPAAAERLLATAGVPMVLDFDDAWFHRYDAHPRPAVRALLGGKVGRAMRAARLVVAGNPYIADHAVAAGAARVEIVPTVVDTDRIAVAPPAERPLTLGWIGTPANARYLDPIRPALADLCREGAARLLIVGGGPAALGGLPGEARDWDEAREAADLADMDIGLMPLPDTPFERGKCGYKLIQYMAAGRPAVASPVGVNGQIVRPGETGFLADDPDEWRGALRALARDPALRARLGVAGRARAEAEFSLRLWAPRMVDLLSTSFGGR